MGLKAHEEEIDFKKLYPRLIFITFLAATLISFYRMALSYAHDLRNTLYFNDYYKPSYAGEAAEYAQDHIWTILLVLIIGAALVSLIQKLVPSNKGSGVPNVIATLHDDKFKNNPIIDIPAKFFASLYAIFAGVSVGSEGPSIHMGGMIGEQVSVVSKAKHNEHQVLVGTGAVAGFTAAFNIPLAAFLFAQEEIYGKFNRKMLVPTGIAVILADFITKGWLTVWNVVYGGQAWDKAFKYASTPVFNMVHYITNMPIAPYVMAIFVITAFSIVMALLAKFYKKSTLSLKANLKEVPTWVKVSISFILVIPIALFLPQAISSAYIFTKYTTNAKDSLFATSPATLLLIAGSVLAFSIWNTGSGFPGGTLVPFMVIGGLIGLALGISIADVMGWDAFLVKTDGIYTVVEGQYYTTFIIAIMLAGMASFIGGVGRTPLMAIAIVIETTGAIYLLPLIFLAGFVGDFVEHKFKGDKPLAVYSAEDLLGYKLHH